MDGVFQRVPRQVRLFELRRECFTAFAHQRWPMVAALRLCPPQHVYVWFCDAAQVVTRQFKLGLQSPL